MAGLLLRWGRSTLGLDALVDAKAKELLRSARALAGARGVGLRAGFAADLLARGSHGYPPPPPSLPSVLTGRVSSLFPY